MEKPEDSNVMTELELGIPPVDVFVLSSSPEKISL
jgi:hypothetical protein